MKFTKMHGIGNDYVYVNCFEETVENPSAVARYVSDRHFGIGSDGLILIKPSKIADCEMDMYNLDGSQGAMCGNGIRCVAKYAYDYGIVNKEHISVATKSGIKYLDLTVENGKVSQVKVNMGSPILTARQIPVVSEKEEVINEPLDVNGKIYYITAVSMGNPHAVIFLDYSPKELELEKIGLDNIYAKEHELMQVFMGKIKTIPGIRIYGDFDMLPDNGLHCAIVSVNIADMDSAEVSDILMNEYGIATRSGIHCAPLMHKFFGTQNQGMVRFSFSYYNTVDEINEAAEALMQIAALR